MIKVTQSSRPQAVVADRLWTVHDVSAFLSVPVGTLYKWRYTPIVASAYVRVSGFGLCKITVEASS